MNEKTKTIVLAGATGELGALIANALLDKPGVAVRVLVRPGSRAKAQKLSDRGAAIVEVALDDAGQADALAKAMAGAYSVVSALQGGPEVIVEAQFRLLEAARGTGVRRFIPSDFSFNIFGLADGENVASDLRRSFASHAAESRGTVEVVHILNGCFIDRRVLFGFLGAFDTAAGKAFLWGDGEALMDFTTYEDTARFTAEVAVDPAPLDGVFSVAGDVLNFHQLVTAYEKGAGKTLEVVRMGSLDDLSAEVSRRLQAEPTNMFAWLPLMYWRAMLNGKGKLGTLGNSRYPGVHPLNVEDYVRREGL